MKGARGEGVIELEDREVPVLFTNKALAQAEKSSGKSVIAMANGFSTGATGIGDLACLLQAGMEAARRDARIGGRPISLNDAYEVLEAVGFAGVAEVTMRAVAAVLGYTRDDEDGDGAEKNE